MRSSAQTRCRASFGLHEVFHALVIVASVFLFAHAVTVLDLLRAEPRRGMPVPRPIAGPTPWPTADTWGRSLHVTSSDSFAAKVSAKGLLRPAGAMIALVDSIASHVVLPEVGQHRHRMGEEEDARDDDERVEDLVVPKTRGTGSGALSA